MPSARHDGSRDANELRVTNQALIGTSTPRGAHTHTSHFTQTCTYITHSHTHAHAHPHTPIQAYYLALQIAHSPVSVLETTFLSVVMYFMSGLSTANGAGNFFYFYALMLSMALYGQAFARLFAFLCPNAQVGEGVSPGVCVCVCGEFVFALPFLHFFVFVLPSLCLLLACVASALHPPTHQPIHAHAYPPHTHAHPRTHTYTNASRAHTHPHTHPQGSRSCSR